MAEDSVNETKLNEPESGAKKSSSFIAIETVVRTTHGQDLCLKVDDILVAIDGNPVNCDIAEFDKMLGSYPDLPVLLTIFRKEGIF